MPLTYRDRGDSGTQFEIISGTALVGNLWKAVLSGTADQQRWCWSWSAGPVSEPRQYGRADNIEEAKAILELQWLTWLKAAGLTER